MSELKIFINGNVLRAIIFDSKENKYKLYEGEEVADIIEVLNKNKNKIKNLFFSGSDLNFNISDLNVILSNINKLKKRNEFSIIFDYVANKKYQLKRQRFVKITALALVAVISTVGITSVKLMKTDSLNDLTPNESYSVFEDEKMSSNTLEDDIKDYDIIKVNHEEKESKETTEENNSKAVDQDKPDVKSQTEALDEESTNTTLSIANELGVGSRTNSEKLIYVKANYGDIIKKYAKTYGVDHSLIMAIATQERAEHSTIVDAGGAIGLMQIQVDVWEGQTITAYNYDTKCEEEVTISLEALKDVEFNIKVGCMIYQNYLKQMEGNTLAAIQSYNMGPGSVNKIITNYANACGKTYEEVLNDYSDTGWLDYRNSSYPGDPDYVENVTRYYDSELNNIIVIN